MKKQKTAVFALLILVVALLAGGACVTVFLAKDKAARASSEVQKAELKYFSDWTEVEEFEKVPALTGEQIHIGTIEDYGTNHYLVDVNGTSVDDYESYLKTLESEGFKRHSDNGEDSMDGYVKTASFQKDKLTVTVSHAMNQDKTYISVANELALSDHLIYTDEYEKTSSADAQTKVSMLELNANGASFVIQLKNGHFIVEDGGNDVDAPYLLDYLDELTPGEEKPVVEAWFISHAHPDHSGALSEIVSDKKYCERVIVDGFYYMEPSKTLISQTSEAASVNKQIYTVTKACNMFEAQDGGKAKLYRPQFGQRYYFAGMEIDICLTPEQLTLGSYYYADFNDTSVWLMHHIDEQKMLIVGDANHGGMRVAQQIFDKSYFDVDVFAVSHHGINVYQYFTDFVTTKTNLYPNWRTGSLYVDDSTHTDRVRTEDNAYQIESALESYSWEKGTVVLTFPYAVGSAQVLEPCDWSHHYGRRQYTEFR